MTTKLPIQLVALIKEGQHYVFIYDDASRAETLRTMGRFASDPELSFTWGDAATLAQRVRREANKAPRR